MGLIARLTRRQPAGGAYGGIVGMGARRYQAYAWEFQRVANSVYANPTGYRCVQWLANNFSRPPFMLTNKQKDPVEDSPLSLLLNSPDENYSGTEMQWAIQRDRQLCGKSFWVKLRGPDYGLEKGPLTRLHRLPPQRVTVVGNDDDELMGFVYADRGGNRAIILPENMLYLRHPHPEREFDGLAPAIVAGLGAETDNAAARFNYDLLSNDSALPGYLTVEDLSPQQFLEWKAQWDSQDYPGKTRFMQGKATYSKVGQSNQELMYDKLRDGGRLDICTGFGVLRQLVDPSDTTFSNMGEAKAITMQQTVLPDWVSVGDQMSVQLLDEYKDVERIFFDLSEIEELQESAKERLDRDIRLLDRRAVTINEVRRRIGLGPVKWGDDPFANLAPNHLGVQPLTGPSTPGGAGGSAEGGSRAPGEEKPENENLESTSLESTGSRSESGALPALGKGNDAPPKGGANGSLSTALPGTGTNTLTNYTAVFHDKGIQEPTPASEAPHPWRVFDQRVTTFEARTAKRMEAYFAKQQKNIVARIQGKAGKAITKATDPEQWWDSARWLAELKELGYEFLADAVDYFGGVILAEFTEAGVFEANARVGDYLTTRSTDIAGLVNNTTEEALRAAIADAEAAGGSIDDIVRSVSGYFETNGKHRAEVVARTEVIGAANWATLEGAKQSGVATGKRWLATADNRVDEACVHLDGERVALDAPFSSGVDHPPDHPQCRCTVLVETT